MNKGEMARVDKDEYKLGDISTWTTTQKTAKIRELENRKDRIIQDCYSEIRKITILIYRLRDSMRNTIDGE